MRTVALLCLVLGLVARTGLAEEATNTCHHLVGVMRIHCEEQARWLGEVESTEVQPSDRLDIFGGAGLLRRGEKVKPGAWFTAGTLQLEFDLYVDDGQKGIEAGAGFTVRW